jgi:hypothetical protein
MTTIRPSIAIVGLLAMCPCWGCDRGPFSTRRTSDIGIASCDAWLDSRRACIERSRDDATMKAQLEAQVTAMRTAVATPNGRKAVESTCDHLLARSTSTGCP